MKRIHYFTFLPRIISRAPQTQNSPAALIFFQKGIIFLFTLWWAGAASCAKYKFSGNFLARSIRKVCVVGRFVGGSEISFSEFLCSSHFGLCGCGSTFVVSKGDCSTPAAAAAAEKESGPLSRVRFFYIDDLLCSAGEGLSLANNGAGWLAAAAAASFPAASRTQKERATDALCTEQRKRREEERRKCSVFHCRILKYCRTTLVFVLWKLHWLQNLTTIGLKLCQL